MLDSKIKLKLISPFHFDLKLSLVLIIMFGLSGYFMFDSEYMYSLILIAVITYLKVFDIFFVFNRIIQPMTYTEVKDFKKDGFVKTALMSDMIYFFIFVVLIVGLSYNLFNQENIIWRIVDVILMVFLIIKMSTFYTLTRKL